MIIYGIHVFDFCDLLVDQRVLVLFEEFGHRAPVELGMLLNCLEEKPYGLLLIQGLNLEVEDVDFFRLDHRHVLFDILGTK